MADMTTSRVGRPKGAKQILPTAEERRQYIIALRKRADAGDPQAIAALLSLGRGDA